MNQCERATAAKRLMDSGMHAYHVAFTLVVRVDKSAFSRQRPVKLNAAPACLLCDRHKHTGLSRFQS